jgi:all-trans-retinol 13,14-reductase
VRKRGAKKIARIDRSLLRKKFHKKHIVGKEFNTIIIGSGMGSLSCAAILARLGRSVLVLEQHPDVAGGGTHQFDLGGYRFDSGLHYTVPWSAPVFALTCLLRPMDVTPFDMMGEADSTIDNIYLDKSSVGGDITHFKMLLHEKHLPKLYAMFPHDKEAIDTFIDISDKAVLFIKLYIIARLMPKWIQRVYWTLVPQSVIEVASLTSEEILPQITSNKKLVSLLSSMWIDTGARPDQASFAMSAAVFRGISMEGGCYPSRGAEEMAIELARVIVDNGGTILINAKVKEIIVNTRVSKDHGGMVSETQGVLMDDVGGTCVMSNRVVSGAGFMRTFRDLIDAEVTHRLDLPTELDVAQSAGFVMVNIGIKAGAGDIGASPSNSWHIPIDETDDLFQPMKEYFNNPLEVIKRRLELVLWLLLLLLQRPLLLLLLRQLLLLILYYYYY